MQESVATVSLKAIRQRLRGYLLRKDPWPVLFVVPDASRQKAIAQVSLEEARLLKANPTMIWLTTKDWMTPETILSAPWLVVGRETPVTFQGLAEPVEAASDAAAKENAVVFAGNGGQFG